MNAANDPRIDAALDSYPPAPLPPGFSRRLMARIVSDRAAAPPVFRLNFLDFIIPACLALTLTLVFSASLYARTLLDPLLLARLRLQLLLLSQQARFVLNQDALPLLALLAAGLALGLLGALAGFASLRPRLGWE